MIQFIITYFFLTRTKLSITFRLILLLNTFIIIKWCKNISHKYQASLFLPSLKYGPIRNIPKYVHTLQVQESFKVPFYIIPHRSSNLLRVSPVKFKYQHQIESKSMRLWYLLDAMSRISVNISIKPEWLKSDVVRVGEFSSTAWLWK